MKLEISGSFFFEKCTNIKCHGNPSSGSRVVPCGQTDRHDEAKSRFSCFLYFVDRASRHRFLLITNLTHFFMYLFIHFISLHVSSITVLIIRRSNCINTSSGIFLTFLLTVHHAMILGNCPTWRTNYFQCIYLFIVLYMFRTCHAQFVSPDDEHDMLETCREL